MITAVLKARNESARLREAISRLGWCDRVVVVDDMSTDDTAAVAKSAGAIVIRHSRVTASINELDYVGFESVEEGWILRLDCDEEIPAKLAERLIRLSADPDLAGVLLPRLNIVYGQPLLHGGWNDAVQMKFFRAANWDRKWDILDIHSQVPVRGRITRAGGGVSESIIHPLYESFAEFCARSLVGYASFDLRSSSPSLLRLFVVPVKVIIWRLVARSGWRDGRVGVIATVWIALYAVACELYGFDSDQASTGVTDEERSKKISSSDLRQGRHR